MIGSETQDVERKILTILKILGDSHPKSQASAFCGTYSVRWQFRRPSFIPLFLHKQQFAVSEGNNYFDFESDCDPDNASPSPRTLTSRDWSDTTSLVLSSRDAWVTSSCFSN